MRKKILTILGILISISGFAQYNISPNCTQTMQLPGVDTLLAQMTAIDGVKGITFKFISGPNTPTMGNPIVTSTTSLQLTSILPLGNLVAGTYLFTATGTSNKDTIRAINLTLITLAPIVSGTPPTVSAGLNQIIILPTNATLLVGTASGNKGATIKSYLWSELSGPSTFTLSNAGSSAATISNLQAGVYVFQLKVTDNNGLTATSQVTITVTATPPNCAACLVQGINPAGISIVTAYFSGGHWYIQVTTTKGVKTSYEIF